MAEKQNTEKLKLEKRQTGEPKSGYWRTDIGNAEKLKPLNRKIGKENFVIEGCSLERARQDASRSGFAALGET
jgi:hypothetical protein